MSSQFAGGEDFNQFSICLQLNQIILTTKKYQWQYILIVATYLLSLLPLIKVYLLHGNSLPNNFLMALNFPNVVFETQLSGLRNLNVILRVAKVHSISLFILLFLIWQYRLWRLQGRVTKLERSVAEDQLQSNEIIEF